MRRIRRPGRPWNHDPLDQPSAVVATARPARVGVAPRCSTSISGTYAWQPKNPPAITPRYATTDGSPRRSRSVPAGNSCLRRHHDQHETDDRSDRRRDPARLLRLQPGPLHDDRSRRERRRQPEPALAADLGTRRTRRASGSTDEQRRRHERDQDEERPAPRDELGQTAGDERSDRPTAPPRRWRSSTSSAAGCPRDSTGRSRRTPRRS